MLRLNIERSGIVYDGNIDLDIADTGDHWHVSWSLHVRFGTMKWGKFWPCAPEVNKSGGKSIPKNVLAQSWLDETTSFEQGDVIANKTSPQGWDFRAPGVSGHVDVRYDGDPVEPVALSISALGMSLVARA